MTLYVSAPDTAKLVKKALSAGFAGTKFSVRTAKYAGRASLDVHWTEGPTTPKVDAALKSFEGSEPDTSADVSDPVIHEKDGQRIQYGADHILTTRVITQATYDTIQSQVLESMGLTLAQVRNWEQYPVPALVLEKTNHFRHGEGSLHDLVRAIAENQDDTTDQ